MGVIDSFPKKAFDWAFRPGANNPKHLRYPHAIFAFLVGLASTIVLSEKISTWLKSKYSELRGNHDLPEWGRNVVVPLLIAYMVLMMAIRLK